jgi:hypothetical protein
MSRNRKSGYVFYSSFINAYIAYKLLHNQSLRGGSIRIECDWIGKHNVDHEMSSEVHMFVNARNW